MSKKFPDLTGDGKITKADILKGRKVFADGGSLMIPVERQQYAFGAAVKGIISAAKKAGGKPSLNEPLDSGVKEGLGIDNKAIEKALSTRNIENKNALFFNKKELKELKAEVGDENAYSFLLEDLMKIRETDDEIVKLALDLKYSNKDVASFLSGDPSILPKLQKEYDEVFEEGTRSAENQAAKDVIERNKKGRPRIPTDVKKQRKEVADLQKGISRFRLGEGREKLKRSDIPDGSGPFRAAWIKAWQNYKDEFTYKGNKYSMKDSTPEREAKAIGGILVKAALKKGSKAAYKESADMTSTRNQFADDLENAGIMRGESTSEVVQIDAEDLKAMSPQGRKLFKALEKDDFLGFDTVDDAALALFDDDLDNFDISSQLKKALGEYVNAFYGGAKREAKAIGGLAKGIASFAGAKASRDAPKVTAARKASVASGDPDNVAEMLEEALMQNPRLLDEMPETDFQALMAELPPAYRSKLDPDMGAVVENKLELVKGMEPAEVAKNLQLFDTLEQLKQYATALNPKETREFLNSVSPEDYDLFEGFEGLIQQLGPREMKAHGGTIGLLVPVEGIKPDGEMEDDYVSYVMDETLSDDEIEYVNKALESDNRLSELFDKIVLSSAEFTGAGEVDGPGTGTSDEIPARLSDGEFVFTKKAVDQIGVEKLEEMMKDAENEYDASRQDMALGGLMNDPTQDEKANLPDQAMSDDQIEEQMLDANRIPSLMRR